MDAPEIRTERLKTRPWTEDDAGWYVDAIDSEILRWTREPGDLTPDTWRRCLADSTDGRSRSDAITVGDQPVGNVSVMQRRDSAEISYWLAADARGNGYASEVLLAVGDWASESLDIDYTYLEISPENAPSIAVAQRCGYSLFGYQLSDDDCADDLGRVAVYRKPA
ncbi:MAG: GNAT family N-acetyltransferase [Acidimicrobiia bacterium]